MKNIELYEYQKKTMKFIINTKKCALFLEMGLGKTIICLFSIIHFFKKENFKKVLIIAPLKVANTVWKQEAKNLYEFDHINIEICTGNIKKRLSIMKKNFDILIINNENLIWLLDNFNICWDMLIIDESSTFKNYKSKRFKCLVKKKIDFKRIILLSGTPCPNNYIDLWSQIYLLDKGARLGKNITNYKNNFFLKKDFMGYVWELKKNSKNTIKKLISDICLTMKIEDHINLPGKKYINCITEFPESINSVYKQMEKKFFIEINKENITAVSSAVCANKLLQICNGSIYDNNKNTIYIHNKKIIMLKNIIQKYKNENFFIAYNFKSDLDIIKKNFPQAIQLSPSGEEINLWNNNKIKILLAHPLSSCYGLNAYKGGHIIIWYGLNWSLQSYLQFNSRLYRIGQNNNVKIINLLIKGGLDEKIVKCLKKKYKNQNYLLKNLKKLGV